MCVGQLLFHFSARSRKVLLQLNVFGRSGLAAAGVGTWIRRENAASGPKWRQLGGSGEYRFSEAFYHR